MKLKFTKMQGVGNDYIYIDCFERDIRLDAQAISFLSDRRFGIGGDGVIFIRPCTKADGFMDMYNLDGSFGMMCGNGVRCVGKYLYDHGYAKSANVAVDTRSGVKTMTMQLGADGKAVGATVDMGVAVLECRDIPVRYGGSNIEVLIKIDCPDYSAEQIATCVSMGNPHAVIFTDGIDSLDLERIGPYYENYRLFPNKVNTEFAEVISSSELRMRVWERGSGETLACGTGACAVGVSAVLRGYCRYDSPVLVHLRGGDLTISYSRSGAVTMSGAAAEVFTGEIDI
ncbi:MAG: diaminopimelate epimerase [Oscillospiraceae bacterium]